MLAETKPNRKPVSDETRRKMSEGQLRRRGWERSQTGVLLKPCSQCRTLLEVTEENYPRDRSRWNGFYHRCKKCCSARNGIIRNPTCVICGGAVSVDVPLKKGRKRRVYPNTVCSPACKAERRKLTAFDYNLRVKYGITHADYDRMLSSQGGCCAICRCTASGAPRGGRWLVDHDHTTGAVRGLLCVRCNTGLGLFGDSSVMVQSAAEYLVSRGTEEARALID